MVLMIFDDDVDDDDNSSRESYVKANQNSKGRDGTGHRTWGSIVDRYALLVQPLVHIQEL